MTGTAAAIFQTELPAHVFRGSAPITEPDIEGMATELAAIDARLCAACRPELDLSEDTARWIVVNAAMISVSAQPEQKQKGGRPRGGVSEAARAIPLPKYMSESAKRQLLQRRIRIARIFPRAKQEARVQELDDNQTALLAIAKERTEEAQVEVARAWRFRNVPRSVLPAPESYTITVPDNLTARQRQKLKRVMKLVTSHFHASVLHANPSSIDE